MRLDIHMQYRVSQSSKHLTYLPAHVTNFVLGRKCVTLPHMTKGHICAPQIFQRKWFQSIFPHMWGQNIEELYAKIPLTSTYYIHRSWILQKMVWSHVHPQFSPVFFSRSKLLGRNSKHAMRHDSKRQITSVICYKTTETATTELHTMRIK